MDVHLSILCDCQFCENWHDESHTLLLHVNRFLSVVSTVNAPNLGKIWYTRSGHNAVEQLKVS